MELEWGVGYVIHHHHWSPVVDFPKNMKMGERKKFKERNTRKMEEGGPGDDEAKEMGKKILLVGGIMKLILN